MRDLEKELRRSLARKDVPTGFHDRLLEKLDADSAGKRARRRMNRALSRIAAVLLVGTVGTGAWIQYQQSVRERLEAEQASVLVKLALHIASEKTNIAREHLTGVGTDERKEGTKNEKTND